MSIEAEVKNKLEEDGANLSGQCFDGLDLSGVIAMRATLDRTSFRSAILYWGIFMGTSFREADFTDTNLQRADLKKCDFQNAILVRTNFGRDNLGGPTQLQGADLRAAKWMDVILDGAEYDEDTLFPKGFYPDKHGMVKRKS